MRLLKGLLVGLVAAGLAGCSVAAASEPSTAGPAATAPAVRAPYGPSGGTGQPADEGRGSCGGSAVLRPVLGKPVRGLLGPAVPRHEAQVSGRLGKRARGCPSAGAGKSRTIKAVTVFGNAAIVTEAIAGAAQPGTAEDVFNYANGHWGYSPEDLSIYHHGSVAADIAAAKAAGFCAELENLLIKPAASR